MSQIICRIVVLKVSSTREVLIGVEWAYVVYCVVGASFTKLFGTSYVSLIPWLLVLLLHMEDI